MRWQPRDNVWVNGAYGYTAATFRNYSPGGVSYRGNSLPYSPRNTLFASAFWRLPWLMGKISTTVGLSTRCAGPIYWDEANTLRQNFYGTLGADVTFVSGAVELSLWGENLTNTRYNTFYFKSIGHQFVQRADPWSIGATVRVNLRQD